MSFEETLIEIVKTAVREEFEAHSSVSDLELLTAEEVARLLKFSDRRTVYKLQREGQLKAVILGEKTVRFSQVEIRRYIREHGTNGNGET